MSVTLDRKRRRTDVQCNHIIDLPVGLLVHVTTYLAKPSRALFAVAMTASSSSSDWKTTLHYFMQEELSDNSKAILSSLEWDLLDFEDIEKSLAVKLTDDDLHAVLKWCISAHGVLKKLKLTGCINITGCSLEPLRRSTVIEQMDLSLSKQFESPRSNVESKISEEVVIPILDSIISANGSSLKYLLLPICWN